MHPIRVPHTDSGRDVRAVGGAVDDGLVHVGVFEDRAHIVDHLVDGQRLWGQVGAGVVMAGHPDAAVLHHDHVKTLGYRAPPKPSVEGDGGGAGAAGYDDERMR